MKERFEARTCLGEAALSTEDATKLLWPRVARDFERQTLQTGPIALSGGEPLIEGAKDRLKRTVELVIGFCAGCIVGAAAVSWLGPWAWLLPVSLAGLAMALH